MDTSETYCDKDSGCVFWGKPDCPYEERHIAYPKCTAFRDTLPTRQEAVREKVGYRLFILDGGHYAYWLAEVKEEYLVKADAVIKDLDGFLGIGTIPNEG